jgi:hypothetical protein
MAVDYTVPRRCVRCGLIKEPHEYSIIVRPYTGKLVHRKACKECLRFQDKAYLQRPQAVLRRRATYRRYWEKLDDEGKRLRRYHNKVRAQEMKRRTIQVYGGQCECCGEMTPEFLSIDHIDGRDPSVNYDKERFRIRKAVLRGVRIEGLRLLCYNCNCGREWNGGICPHVDFDPELTPLKLRDAFVSVMAKAHV